MDDRAQKNQAEVEEEENESEDEDYDPSKDADESSDSGDDDASQKEAVDETQIRKLDEQKKQAAWKEFLNGTTTENKKTETVEIVKHYDFAGETITVLDKVEVDKVKGETKPTQATSSKVASIPTQVKRPASGLSALVSSLKKPKMSTLTKSQIDWDAFKKKEEISEELDQHRRSKESFIERQAFLLRTDLREFEREKAVREHERKSRNANPNV